MTPMAARSEVRRCLRRVGATAAGVGASILVLLGYLRFGEALHASEGWLGVYLLLWPATVFGGGALTGVLLPAAGNHPAVESVLSAPGLWVVVFGSLFSLFPAGPPAMLVAHTLSWGGAFAGLTLWNAATNGGSGKFS